MLARDRWFGTVLALTLVVGACSKPHPAAPPEVPVVPDEPKPEPSTVTPATPPPPKCEELSEKCVSGAEGTPVRIARSSYQFKLDKGWTYAQGASVTIAQLSETGGVMAFTTYDTAKGKAEETNRTAAVDMLIKATSVSPPKKKKISLGSMKGAMKAGDLKVSVAEFEDAERGGKKGTLGVFLVPLSDGHSILGIGLKLAGEPGDVDQAILHGINSIGIAPPPSAGGSSGSRGDAGGSSGSSSGSSSGAAGSSPGSSGSSGPSSGSSGPSSGSGGPSPGKTP